MTAPGADEIILSAPKDGELCHARTCTRLQRHAERLQVVAVHPPPRQDVLLDPPQLLHDATLPGVARVSGSRPAGRALPAGASPSPNSGSGPSGIRHAPRYTATRQADRGLPSSCRRSSFRVSSSSSNFLNSDLHKFDQAFGLADPPSFTKLDQNGGTSYPPTDPAGAGNSNWEGEIALDVEYGHGMATHSHLKFFLGNCRLSGSSGACQPSDLGLEEGPQLPAVRAGDPGRVVGVHQDGLVLPGQVAVEAVDQGLPGDPRRGRPTSRAGGGCSAMACGAANRAASPGSWSEPSLDVRR